MPLRGEGLQSVVEPTREEGHHPSMEASGSGLLMMCRLARIKLAMRPHGGALEGVALLPGEEEGHHPSPEARGSGFHLVCRLTSTSLTVSMERQPVQAESSKTMRVKPG
jgi:hypothetical protein